jgi:predicted lipid-binding transport protein (Tim44 family)
MKRFLAVLLGAALCSGLVLTDAEAKRLGGGRSLGMQRDQVIRRDIAPQPPAPPSQVAPVRPATPAPMPARSGLSRWLGPIAGLAAGIGLAALFSHLGLGEEFATIAMLMLLMAGAVLLFRLLRRPQQNAALQYAGTGREPVLLDYGSADTAPASQRTSIPAGFDVEGFVRQAKLNFVRLQASHDAADIEDIRRFTSPQMLAEIMPELQQRGAARQQTDVVTLDAEALDVRQEGRQYVASVRFHGAIRESEGAAPIPFDEVWHLTKPVDGSGGWVIAGIQQSA